MQKSVKGTSTPGRLLEESAKFGANPSDVQIEMTD